MLVLLAVAGGVATEGVLAQEVWTPRGLERLAWFAGGYLVWSAAWCSRRSQWFARATVGLGILWAAVASGPLAVASVCLVLGAAYAVGRRVAEDRLIALAAGLAVIVFAISVSARLPVHHWWVYVAAFVGAIAARRRDVVDGVRHLWGELAGVSAARAALIGFPLLALLAVVPKPEVVADALGMHLVIPAEMALSGRWHFDVQRAIWSVMPMGANWLFTAAYLPGGEAGARLLNYAMLLLAVALVYALAVRVARPWFAALAAALFASTPVVLLVTGSLFVENTWTAFVLAALLAMVREREGAGVREFYAGAALLGTALASKFGAAAYAAAALPMLPLKRRSLVFVGLALVFAAPPYLSAYLATGNPFFPYFNAYWKSPLFETASSFVDDRYRTPLALDTLWEVTFHSSRFLEGRAGAAGLGCALFVPLIVFSIRRRWPYAAKLALYAGAIGFLLTFAAQSYLRYVYPSFAFVAVLTARVLEQLRAASTALGRSAAAAAVALVLLQVYLFATSGWAHRDFWLNPFDPAEARSYVEESAPARFLVDELNRRARGEPVAFLETNQFAGLAAPAFTNSWHHPAFVAKLNTAGNALDALRVMQAHGIRWFVAPAPDSAAAVQQVPVQWMLDRFTTRETQAGKFYLTRTARQYEGDEGIRRAEFDYLAPEVLGPGEHDDMSRSLRYEGAWSRARSFPEARHRTATWSNRPGNTVSAWFEGSEVTWVHARAPNRGKALVTVDKTFFSTVDLYSPRVEWGSVKTLGPFPRGAHELTIRVLGERSKGATDAFVDVDALVVR